VIPELHRQELIIGLWQHWLHEAFASNSKSRCQPTERLRRWNAKRASGLKTAGGRVA
jgi:hypothetical protein